MIRVIVMELGRFNVNPLESIHDFQGDRFDGRRLKFWLKRFNAAAAVTEALLSTISAFAGGSPQRPRWDDLEGPFLPRIENRGKAPDPHRGNRERG